MGGNRCETIFIVLTNNSNSDFVADAASTTYYRASLFEDGTRKSKGLACRFAVSHLALHCQLGVHAQTTLQTRQGLGFPLRLVQFQFPVLSHDAMSGW
jgi:hypothetical protein